MRLYTKAVMLLPLDEENHTAYFVLMLHNMWAIGMSSIGEQLELIGAIRESTPIMRRIWSNTSEECKHRDERLEFVFRQEKEMRDAVADGRATLDTRASVVPNANAELEPKPTTLAGALSGMTNI